jgi:1-deoxy-D-xylulose-5-phosphate synthase
MKVYCPSNYDELEAMLEDALYGYDGPAAVRYPRGAQGSYSGISKGNSEIIRKGNDVTLVTYGRLINEVLTAAEILEKSGISAEVVKLNTIAPLDIENIINSVEKTGRLIVAEETIGEGCAGNRIVADIAATGKALGKIHLLNLGNRFIQHGTVKELFKLCGIDAESIAGSAADLLKADCKDRGTNSSEECKFEKKDRSAAG